MGTLQDELSHKVIASPKRKIVEGSFNFLKQESIFHETVGFLSKIKSKPKSTIKINKRKERRGKVTIMSKEEINIMNRKKDVKKILEATLNNPVSFGDLYYKIFLTEERDSTKEKYMQNLCQEIKHATDFIFNSSKDGWVINVETLMGANNPSLLDMWEKNRSRRWSLRNKKELTEESSSPTLPHEIDSHKSSKKSAVITFSDNKIIIEREGCTVEVISSEYEIVKIIL